MIFIVPVLVMEGFEHEGHKIVEEKEYSAFRNRPRSILTVLFLYIMVSFHVLVNDPLDNVKESCTLLPVAGPERLKEA